MKHKRIAISVFVLSINCCFASLQQDSTAYEKQRTKVNQLLDQRSQRFGEFDSSLRARSGIFGLKTKKDMQASIDILKQIVTTDNHIFKETKALLDFKDIEKQTVENKAVESVSRITGYINTISKLRKSQDQLHEEIGVLKRQNSLYLNILIVAFLALMTLSFLLFKRKKN
ncbi:hypothetical protein RYH73_15800 [Olivibacter sp. CPCC 100613]|uniref:hypothetical protein n=1 Tax=Olivibacter sp. CPCC 100613 TaxID=3079931 RepID=UPI002FFB85E0